MKKEIEKIVRWAGSKAKDILSDYNLRNLIDQAYSKNPSTRVLARSKLKREHPDIWKEMEL
jgi:hypothetical protein